MVATDCINTQAVDFCVHPVRPCCNLCLLRHDMAVPRCRISFHGGLAVIDHSDAWIKRAEAVLEQTGTRDGAGAESAQFATSMLTALYGPQSQQLKQLQVGIAGIQKTASNPRALDFQVHQHARGVVRNTLAELKAGLIV